MGTLWFACKFSHSMLMECTATTPQLPLFTCIFRCCRNGRAAQRHWRTSSPTAGSVKGALLGFFFYHLFILVWLINSAVLVTDLLLRSDPGVYASPPQRSWMCTSSRGPEPSKRPSESENMENILAGSSEGKCWMEAAAKKTLKQLCQMNEWTHTESLNEWMPKNSKKKKKIE